MREDISPEEKLLRLIRGQKKDGVASKPGIPTDASALKETLGGKQKPKSLFTALKRYQAFFTGRNIIIMALFLSAIYLLSAFLLPLTTITKPVIPQEKHTQPNYEDAKKNDTPAIESYLEQIKNKNIFSSSSTSSQQQPAAAMNSDIIKDINLVGIIAGDNPQAVIEDKKNQKTYYLVAGQYLGEIQIDEIKEGKVIINYKGQKYELYL